MTFSETADSADREGRFLGCLLGGAVGDALGAPVEFMSLPEIRKQFGPGGIRDFAPAYGRIGAITDDTQMTLFTTEGLLRAWVRFANRGTCHPPTIVHRAYLRWLLTQGETPTDARSKIDRDGWLIQVPELWARRAPGNTCLAALRASREFGSRAANNSKGCGGVMRAAPIGLFAKQELAFTLGCETAAITHGHPTGQLTAGYLAGLIGAVIHGQNLAGAIDLAYQELRGQPNSDETSRAIAKARTLALEGSPTPEKAESLGAGWVAEEALAISVYCALVATTFVDGVILAVNHGGDSDSTGSITANILGALRGAQSIPERWLGQLELRSEIEAIASDLYGAIVGQLDLVGGQISSLIPVRPEGLLHSAPNRDPSRL